MEERIAFYSGLFDPFTRGHLNIVIRTLREFDKIIIGVEDEAYTSCDFTQEKRVKMAQQSIADILKFKCGPVQFRNEIIERIRKNPEIVQVIAIKGEVVDTAIRYHATNMIRGVRNETDIHVEEELEDRILLQFRIRNYPLTKKDYELMQTNDEVCHISSTVAKDLCKRGEYIAALHHITPGVHNMVMPHYLKPKFDALFGRDDELWEVLCKFYQKRTWSNFSQVAYLLNRLQIEIVQKGENCKFEDLQRAMFLCCLQKWPQETVKWLQTRGMASKLENVELIKFLDFETFRKAELLSAEGRLMQRCKLLLLTDKENYSLYLRQTEKEMAPGSYEEISDIVAYLEESNTNVLTSHELEIIKANIVKLSKKER